MKNLLKISKQVVENFNRHKTCKFYINESGEILRSQFVNSFKPNNKNYQ